LEDDDGGGGFLVGVDFGVGQAGVVVDDGVNERGAEVRVALGGSCGVVGLFLRPCCLPEVAPTAAVGKCLPNLVTSTWISEPGWSCS
jgi:hypothetical protein